MPSFLELTLYLTLLSMMRLESRSSNTSSDSASVVDWNSVLSQIPYIPFQLCGLCDGVRTLGTAIWSPHDMRNRILGGRLSVPTLFFACHEVMRFPSCPGNCASLRHPKLPSPLYTRELSLRYMQISHPRILHTERTEKEGISSKTLQILVGKEKRGTRGRRAPACIHRNRVQSRMKRSMRYVSGFGLENRRIFSRSGGHRGCRCRVWPWDFRWRSDRCRDVVWRFTVLWFNLDGVIASRCYLPTDSDSSEDEATVVDETWKTHGIIAGEVITPF